jgi:hypothetical protein
MDKELVAVKANLCSIVREAILPDEIQVVFEFLLSFVLFLFDFLEHCLEIHRIGDDCRAVRYMQDCCNESPPS